MLAPEVATLILANAGASALLTYAARRLALARGIIDIPNRRSSHTVATPRGGGAAIVVTSTIAFTLLALRGQLANDLLYALLGGLIVAGVGLIDDQRPLPVRVRLAAHLAAALWALAWLGGLPPVRIGHELVVSGPAGYVLGALGIVWVVNLFNFMDGIDGIAGAEAVFVSWGGALLAVGVTAALGIALAAFSLGAACIGFLLWNWPPAKIFMGDVGSGYLGYTIAVLALASAREDAGAIYIWLILGGVFFVDSTFTLAARLLRGETLHQAHRNHAYQRLARRWGSHRRTTLAVLAVNLGCLLPAAWYARQHPVQAAWVATGALALLVALAVAAGAGRRESRSATGTVPEPH